MWFKKPSPVLGDFEQLVLLGVLRLEREEAAWVVDTQTMAQVLDETLTPQHFSALLLGGFAGSALLLASVGIYGVLS